MRPDRLINCPDELLNRPDDLLIRQDNLLIRPDRLLNRITMSARGLRTRLPSTYIDTYRYAVVVGDLPETKTIRFDSIHYCKLAVFVKWTVTKLNSLVKAYFFNDYSNSVYYYSGLDFVTCNFMRIKAETGRMKTK